MTSLSAFEVFARLPRSLGSVSMVIALAVVAVTLDPALAKADTFYRDTVACSGTYSIVRRSCTGADGTSFTSNASAFAAMSAGDTLLIRGGTYDDRVSLGTLGGTAGSPVTVAGYPGESAILVPEAVSTSWALIISSRNPHVIIRNLTFDGIRQRPDGAGEYRGARIENTHHITLEDLDVLRFRHSGLYVTGTQFLTVRRSRFRDQRSPTCVPGTRAYGLYFHDGSDALFEEVELSGNPGGGMQAYPGPITRLTVTRSQIFGNGWCTTTPVGGVIVAAAPSGPGGGNISGVELSYNEIFGNGPGGTGGSGGGIRLGASAEYSLTGTRILNNVIYNNLAPGSSAAWGVLIHAAPAGRLTGTTVWNNIIVANKSGAILDAGTSSIVSHNACGTSDSCGTSRVALSSIASCTVSTTDFSLRPGSPCVDEGIDWGRPFDGSAPDIGAHESGMTPPSPDRPTMIATRAGSPDLVVVDGLLGASEWRFATFHSFSSSSRSDNRVRFAAQWDDRQLYIGFDVTDAAIAIDAAAAYQNDGVEVFLDPAYTRSPVVDADDRHVIVLANGSSTAPDVTSAAAPRPGGYTVEMAIPWALLEVTPGVSLRMGLLVGNNDRDGSVSAQFDWARLIETGGYARPSLWGDLVLAAGPDGVDAGPALADGGAPSPDAGSAASPDAGPTADAGPPTATCWLVDHTLPDGGRGRATIECEHDVVGCSATPGRGGASGAVIATLIGLGLVFGRRRRARRQ